MVVGAGVVVVSPSHEHGAGVVVVDEGSGVVVVAAPQLFSDSSHTASAAFQVNVQSPAHAGSGVVVVVGPSVVVVGAPVMASGIKSPMLFSSSKTPRQM